MVRLCLTRNTDPAISPPRSAIQHRSRSGWKRFTGIGRGPSPPHQALVLEASQDAAEIPGVERQRAANDGGGEVRSICDFVQDANLCQREPGLEVPLAKNADPLGIEAVEPPHGCDGRSLLETRHDDFSPRP